MKSAKKIAALVLCLVLTLGLCGCGLSDLPLLRSVLKLVSVQNLHAMPEAVMEVSLSGPILGSPVQVSLDIGADADISITPLRFAGDVDLSVRGQKLMTIQTRGGDVDGQFTVWLSEDGEHWQKHVICETAKITEGMKQNTSFNLTDLGGSASGLAAAIGSFDMVGTESVNGENAKRYDTTLDWAGAIQASGQEQAFYTKLKELIKSQELTEEEIAQAFDLSVQQPVSLSVWIGEQSGMPVRVQADLTAAVQEMMKSELLRTALSEVLKNTTESSRALSVDRLTVDVILSRFDSAGEIILPE